MRKSIHSVIFTAALAVAGAALYSGTSSGASAPIPLDKKADDARFREIPNLRQVRKDLQAIYENLHKDVPDPNGHRHKAYDHVKEAIDEISAEIDEYKGDEQHDK